MLPTLSDAIDLFESVDGSAKLELLIDFGARLPPLSDPHVGLRDAGLHMIHECQSPVFLHVEVTEGMLQVHGDVPREAAIARGFVTLLWETFHGVDVAELTDVPNDLLDALGLHDVLTLQRRRGLTAIYRQLLQSAALAFD